MEFTDLAPIIELLDDNIDNLEEALEPVLKSALSDTAGKLPLLDRAHLYVLVTYALESILFSYLRLNGVNAKEHSVFRELTRVKQYFEKINAAESAGTKPNVALDKAAAGRFIKHALVGRNSWATKFASADCSVRLEIRNSTLIRASTGDRKAQPFVLNLKDVPGKKSVTIQETGKELFPQKTVPDGPRSERIKRQVSSGGRERDDGTRAK